jgi:UTP:GlnB (protein PII) uridylyltransferase
MAMTNALVDNMVSKANERNRLLDECARLGKENAELRLALAEARRWIGDGECSDGLARSYWTPEYVSAVGIIDAALETHNVKVRRGPTTEGETK